MVEYIYVGVGVCTHSPTSVYETHTIYCKKEIQIAIIFGNDGMNLNLFHLNTSEKIFKHVFCMFVCSNGRFGIDKWVISKKDHF